jgi:hypothetical protein
MPPVHLASGILDLRQDRGRLKVDSMNSWATIIRRFIVPENTAQTFLQTLPTKPPESQTSGRHRIGLLGWEEKWTLA